MITDQLTTLDVRDLKRRGVVTREHVGVFVEGRQYAAGRVCLNLEWTLCQFSTWRPWFLCPDPRCGRRCAILYLEERSGRLLCRTCLGLSYPSQRARRRRARKKKAS